jgi:alpha-1,2-mannosyltransferase
MTSLVRSLAGVARLVPGFRPTQAQLVAGAAWAAALAAIGHLVVTAISKQMLDLDVYRSGGQAILHHHKLYSIRAADRLPFTYPPLSAILAVPLALVSFKADEIVWVALMYGPLLFAVQTGFRPILTRVGNAAPAVFPIVLAIAAYLQPVAQEVGFGQVDLLLLALCLIDCLAEAPRWPRGMLIGLATAIKLEPGVFIIYLLITGRRRAAGTAALSFGGLTALAWAISPSDSAAYWGGAIFDTSRLGGNGTAGNQALRGMVLRALRYEPHVAPDLVWLPLALLVGVIGFVAARACWRHGSEVAGIAITGLLGALLSPVAWIHHLCWVVVAIGVIVGNGRQPYRVLLAALASALFLTALPTWVEHTQSPQQLASVPGFIMENSFGLAALALIAALGWVGRSAGEPADQVAGHGGHHLHPEPAAGQYVRGSPAIGELGPQEFSVRLADSRKLPKSARSRWPV